MGDPRARSEGETVTTDKGVTVFHADGAEVRRRLRAVEMRMHADGWSVNVAYELAEEFGCSPRTVYRYRARVLDELAEGLRGQDIEEERAEFVRRLQGHQRAALRAGRFGPLSAMLSIEAKVRGLDRPTEAQKQVIEAISPADLAERRQEIAARLLAVNGGNNVGK
jgi:predicted DNA-binding transcriptional regulator YafY